MLSPTFKVRDFSIADIQPYPIRLRWKAAIEGEDGYTHHVQMQLTLYYTQFPILCHRDMTVFKEGDQLYHSKMLRYYRKEPFRLDASYLHPDQIPYPNPFIGKCSVR